MKTAIQFLLVIVCGSLSIFTEEITYQYELCFLVILLFGIPHGSLDYKVQAAISDKKIFNIKRFVGKYLLFMVGYLVMWVLFPFNALLVFIALSLYHFGQERFEELGLKPKAKGWYLVWGSFVLLVPFIAQYAQLQTYIYLITSVHLPGINSSLGLLLIGLIVILNMGYITKVYLKERLLKSDFIKSISLIVLLTPIFIFAPLIVSFTVYFILVHSFNAMNHQFQWFKLRSPKYSLFAYLKELTPFTLMAYLGVGIILFIVGLENWQSLTLYLLVFASLLTLPHMLIFEDFYADRSSS